MDNIWNGFGSLIWTAWVLHTRDFRDRHGRQATETRFLLRPKGLLAIVDASIALYSCGIARHREF